MDGVTGFLVALLTAAVTAGACVYGIERSNLLPPKNVPPEAIVPDLHAMTETDARSNANAAHVALFVAGREASTDSKAGTVLRQSIAAGHHIPVDSTVEVILVADDLPKVPDVGGLPLAQATYGLEQAGYTIYASGTVPDPKIPGGSIVSQVPKAGRAYAKGGLVIVEISAGPGEVEVPKLLGTGVAAAKMQLEQLGLKAVVHWIAVGETPTNVVLSQDPAPGKKVKPGGEVQVTVCSG